MKYIEFIACIVFFATSLLEYLRGMEQSKNVIFLEQILPEKRI